MWGGKIEIESAVGKGTMLKILLPREISPAWFVPKLNLKKNSTVIVFDDDRSIHHIWKGRIEALNDPTISLIHLGNPVDLRKYFTQNSSSQNNSIYLMDYEILNHKENGLDLIEELGIQKNSILVTSHYEEIKIINICKKLDVRLIPKSMSGFIPIEIQG